MVNKKIRIFTIILLGINGIITGGELQWSWETHEYINHYATELLPDKMDFFKSQADYLSAHAGDPDQDELPGYYHYIDIDWYPEFLEGTLPHEYDDIVELYGEAVVIDNGTVPWIIEQWTEELSLLMKYGEWDYVWQVAAELGHYVADAHQPLHLTVNYNGQYSGNYGVHSRYETRMIGAYLHTILPPQQPASYIENVLDSTFSWIEEVYPGVDLIMAADDYAHQLDPGEGSLYYETMWNQLDSLTIAVIQKAMIDLASLWNTAWINAGKPLPPSAKPGILNIPHDYSSIQNAIDAAVNGDTLLVQPDTYFENLDFAGKNIVVGSLFLLTNDTSYITRTIIDGRHLNSVVTFTNNETTATILTGFTITNGDATVVTNPNRGGGISCDYASPTLRNLIIRNNYAYHGGGLNLTGNSNHQPRLQNIRIVDNTAVQGGGIYCRGASPIIANGIIRNNTGLPDASIEVTGTGLFLTDCLASLDRLLIFNNSLIEAADDTTSDTTFYIDNSNVKCTHIILFERTRDKSPIFRISNSFSTLVNSIVWQTEIELQSGSGILISHSIIENGRAGIQPGIGDSLIWLAGNLDTDPLFENPDIGDFSIREKSPAIDAGLALLTWNNDTLINIPPEAYFGSAPDIGCYESNYILNIDNTENIPEQFILLQNYPNPFNPTTTIRYELLKDGYVLLKVYNINGQEIATLVSQFQNAGIHRVNFDATGLAAGLYFYHLRADQRQATEQMLLLK